MDSRKRALVRARMVAPLVPEWRCCLKKVGFPVNLELCRDQPAEEWKDGEVFHMAEVDRLCELLRTVNGIGDLPITDPYSLAQKFLDLVQLEGKSDIASSVLRQVDRHRARACKAFVARYDRMFQDGLLAYDPVLDQEALLPPLRNLRAHDDVVAYLSTYGRLLDGERIRVLSQMVYLGPQGLSVDRGMQKAYPHGIRCVYGQCAGFFEAMSEKKGLPQWWAVPYKGC